MNKISKILLLLAVILLLANVAYASNYDVKVNPVKDKIVVDDIAEFEIVVQNNLDTNEEFTIKKAGYPFWDTYTKPLQNPITLDVPAHSNGSIKLFIDPVYITNVDTYTIDLGVALERLGEEQKVPITIGIKSIEPLIGGYIPNVLASIGILPEQIDPRKQFTVKISLDNQNPINYSDLRVKIDSSLFNEELHTPLGPKEQKTLEFSKKLDELTLPQKASMTISAYKDERVIVNPFLKEFEVVEYSTKDDLPEEQSFLKFRKGVKITSNNPEYKTTVKIETTPIKNIFTTTSPKAESFKENGVNYLVWQVDVGEKKQAVVYTIENYRPIVVIVVLIIAAIVIYFVFRSPIVVRKDIANVGMSEGGISEAKVVVRIKNRSSSQIMNIEVLDNVPHIAHVEKEVAIGSMQPHAILTHPKKGMIIKWNIEALDSGEERVLSYKMKSRLSILGEFNLPAASARCKVGDKVIISNSNRISVGG